MSLYTVDDYREKMEETWAKQRIQRWGVKHLLNSFEVAIKKYCGENPTILIKNITVGEHSSNVTLSFRGFYIFVYFRKHLENLHSNIIPLVVLEDGVGWEHTHIYPFDTEPSTEVLPYFYSMNEKKLCFAYKDAKIGMPVTVEIQSRRDSTHRICTGESEKYVSSLSTNYKGKIPYGYVLWDDDYDFMDCLENENV